MDEAGLAFELGGIKFEVISLPGAEGINSAGLWMPEERTLFADGGSVGPENPTWPNLGALRETVNQTGGWFAYKYTSELYPYRPHEIYPALVKMAGVKKVFSSARDMLSRGELEKALMMAEAVIEADSGSKQGLQLQLDVLNALLKRAQTTYKTFSEIAWLQSQITKVTAAL